MIALLIAAAAATSAPSHGLGLYVSNIAGSGITYGHAIGAGWGFHVSGIGWAQTGSSSSFYNVGCAITRDINLTEWGKLYGLVGVGGGTWGFNATPGLGVQYGPLMLELGYSVYANTSGVGFVPAGGGGLMWNF